MRRWMFGTMALLALMATMFVAPAANADVRCLACPDRVLPAAVPASYSGTALARGAGTITAYRWTASGWVATVATAGSAYQVQPYTGGWHWAYRNGSWYAMRTTDLTPFSCTTATLAAHRAWYGGSAYSYASQASFLTTLSPGETYYPICTNDTADASGATDFGGSIRSYYLAWIWRGGAWTKAYVSISSGEFHPL